MPDPKRGAAPLLDELHARLNAFLNGTSGLRFDVLVRFAEPLFDLYEADPRASRSLDRERRDAHELALQVAVLETARLLWAFLELDAESRMQWLPDLEVRLLGAPANSRERNDLLHLLRLLQKNADTLPTDVRHAASLEGMPLPPFEELLQQYAPDWSVGAPAAEPEGYGPDRLDLPEAQALFSRPLLEDPALLDDPDKLDVAISLANAYWELAHTPRDEQPRQIAALQRQFASTQEEADRLKAEASAMIERFYLLFPERRQSR